MKLKLTLICFSAAATITGCNPVSQDYTEKSWSSLHSVKPFQSNYYHGADYHFPAGSCDEPQCHGTDLKGGNSGAPSCYSCHGDVWTIFSTTHTQGRGGFYHHYSVDDTADTSSNATWFNTCKNLLCHGSALDGVGGKAYSCMSCHSGFSGLIPPPGHNKSRDGSWHKSSGSCAGSACHGTGSGENYTGGSAASSVTGLSGHGEACSSCHDGEDK